MSEADDERPLRAQLIEAQARVKREIEILESPSGIGQAPDPRGDIAALTQIPGVGKKTAERIVLELRDKLATMEAHHPSRPESPAGPVEDVISALVNLGYERHAAESAVESSKQKGAQNFEVLLKTALQKLASPVERMARAAR